MRDGTLVGVGPVRLAALVDQPVIAIEWRRAVPLPGLGSIASTRVTAANDVAAANGEVAWVRVSHSALPVFLPGLAVAGLAWSIVGDIGALAH